MTTIQRPTDTSTTTRREPFVKMPTEIVRDPTLSDAAFRLLAEIRSYAWESLDGVCYREQEHMADDLGWGIRKVRDAARELLDHGLITRQRTGRQNHYRLVRSAEDRRSDRRNPASLIGEIPPVVLRRHQEEETSRSRTGGDDEATGETTTTTTTAPLDAEADVEYLLNLYEAQARYSAGRVPRRRPKDVNAARSLAAYFDEQAAPILEQTPDDNMEFAWDEYTSVLEWAFEDPFTRRKGGVARGFADLADRYDSIAAKRAEMPDVECSHCHEQHRLASDEQADYERHEMFICRPCRRRGLDYFEL